VRIHFPNASAHLATKKADDGWGTEKCQRPIFPPVSGRCSVAAYGLRVLWAYRSVVVIESLPTAMSPARRNYFSICNVSHLNKVTMHAGGARWRSWVKHCVTSRKVKVSVPNGSLEVFIDLFLLAALGAWSQPSFRRTSLLGVFPGDKGGQCVRLIIFSPSRNSGNFNILES